MRKSEYLVCKDEVSMVYADLLKKELQISLGLELVSEETLRIIGVRFQNFDRKQTITYGRKLLNLYEKVLRRELDEENLIREWEKITGTDNM